MKLRKLKSFSIRHYDTNSVEKREKKIWKETTITNKVIALVIGWMLIGGFLSLLIYALILAPDLNSIKFEDGYSVTQEEYACLVSGSGCEVCVIDDIDGCSDAVKGMHGYK